MILPAKMQDALSAAARQSKLSEAKVINVILFIFIYKGQS
jgi:hypothetical protein